MKHPSIISIGFLLISAAALAAEPDGSKRAEEVQQHSREVVPYSLDQTLQSFTKTVHGGIQHVVVKPEADKEQIKLIQEHLRELTTQFRKGDFSSTQRVHGADMPGLIQLKKAALDDIKYEYESLPNGAQIHFSTEYPQYVQALHEWFDAQRSDHGSAVVPEHMKHHSSPSE
jgi:glutathione S-transferase